MHWYNHFLKRPFDLFASLILLLFTSWLILLIVTTYFITNNLPFFYCQKRIGRNGGFFMLYKFRTLEIDQTQSLQQRRFPLGDFLRKYSLDELPQLLNVLIGNMSLIGPRPLPVEYASLFSEDQKKRHSVRPGITGLAQVNGKNSISWKEKFEYDLYYVGHVSFLLDVRILVKTIILLFSFRADVSLNEAPFKGDD